MHEILGRELSCEEKVLLCLASPQKVTTPEAVECAAKLNAQRFHALVTRHKLAPALFFSAHPLLNQLPGHVATQLKQQATAIAKRMLLVGRDMIEIQKRSRNENIHLLFLKGPALAMQLFGDVGRRYSVDIDIMVDKNDLDRTDQMLKSLNYLPLKSEEGRNLIMKRLFRYAKKDRAYKKPGQGVPVEVHYRLFPNNTHEKQEKILVQENIGHVLLAGEEVPVLNLPFHFLFLAAHGSVHQWFQLFWLRDIAEILHAEKISDWNHVLTMAKVLGLERSLVLAVQLSHLIFGTPMPRAMESRMEVKMQRYLRDACVRAIFYPLQENLGRRIKRMCYLSMLDSSLRYKWNTFLGAAGRFILDG